MPSFGGGTSIGRGQSHFVEHGPDMDSARRPRTECTSLDRRGKLAVIFLSYPPGGRPTAYKSLFYNRRRTRNSNLHAPNSSGVSPQQCYHSRQGSRPEGRTGEKAIDVPMAKSTIRKRTRRPATVKAPVKTLRLPPDLAERIDRWAKAMGKESHSEAMRHLLELGLKTPKRKACSLEKNGRA